MTLDDLSDEEIERLYNAGCISDHDLERLVHARVSPQDLAVIDAFAYGLAKLFHTPIDQLAAEAASARGADKKVTGSAARGTLGAAGDTTMSAFPHIGADGQSYPEVASRAVANVHQQNPSSVYGYFRTGAQQKIYLFPTLEDARGWISVLIHGQQPHDYAAVFSATDLTRPVPGLESFGHTNVSGETVGSWLPFLLGLPAGALGGYFLRRWQEDEHPGQSLRQIAKGGFEGMKQGMKQGAGAGASTPATSGDWVGGPWLDIEPVVGGPWLDIEPVVGGPWLDVEETAYTIGGPWLDIEPVVGASMHARRRESAAPRTWPQTKALIRSAINEVTDAASSAPATAYVWSLDPPSAPPYYTPSSAYVTLEGTTGVMPFGSVAEALDYMRSRIGTPHVALALFDRTSPHWPNPTNWTKSNDPSHESVIAAQAAKATPPVTAGVGANPMSTAIGAALDDVRTRSQSIANKRAGSVVGVIHTTKDGLWHALAFRNADDADDWLGTATQEPASYTYAAYYDKEDFQWPHPVNEKIGGVRSSTSPGSRIRRGVATTSGAWGA